jgi:hypothetical protein
VEVHRLEAHQKQQRLQIQKDIAMQRQRKEDARLLKQKADREEEEALQYEAAYREQCDRDDELEEEMRERNIGCRRRSCDDYDYDEDYFY